MELRTRVLIVDNDPDVLFTLRTVFEAEGFDVALAADGPSAMRQLAEARPDVIVLDVAMPVLDGWYVLAELAGLIGAPPVVVTSAKGHPLDVTRAYALGACEYVVRPFDADALVAKARRASEMYSVVA